ncbi:unnamed protein product [Macrosiphum euphorbiae]|uniref:Macro domain-containing protein n=1 Tax=Macrosiphum euphorbiae TaxID=13131 RepID=A0AAV0XU67_9HEMI|nr:unnamed protein product [Macrosiphum euphorbiae]
MLNKISTPVTRVSFDTYLELITGKSLVNNMVIEETGDLFDAPLNYSITHYISQDVKMSQGMAIMFRRKFGNVEILKSQHPKIHGVLYIRQENRYILYMVTKPKYWQKPSLEDMFLTVQNLKFVCIELNIKKLEMPRYGSGFDQLDWLSIRTMIRFIFKETDIEIHFYSLTEIKHAEKQEIIAKHHSSILG